MRADGSSQCCDKVMPPLDEGRHVGGQLAVEVHLLSCARMDEAQRLGMKSLPRTQLETVVNKLRIAR